tara:strand:+ start:244 stop:759 length:516 start_codon:yes stop_codon:yes gene_type:complete
MKTRKTEKIDIRVSGKEKQLLKNQAIQARKTLSQYIRYKLNEEHTEWTKHNTIETYISYSTIFDGWYHQSKIEIPVSYLKCMPLYKWQYCHEVLRKQKGYCDGSFGQFINELRFHFTCASRLIKLDCLDKLERKKLISLFKREFKKHEYFNNSRIEKEFIEAVAESKTILK